LLIKQSKSLQEIQDEKDYLQMLESKRQYPVQQIDLKEEKLKMM